MEIHPKKCTLSGKPPDGVTVGAPQPIDPSTGMHRDYYILCDEERAKGFVRPFRDCYRHVGTRPKFPTRELTPEQKERYANCNYVAFEAYPESESPVTGRFWTAAQLRSGCGEVTVMGNKLSETYARQPDFYGSTFCAVCGAHFPVGESGEFIWEDGTGARVGT